MLINLSVFVFFIYLFFNSVAMSVVYCFCSWCCFLCYFLVCNLLLWPLCILIFVIRWNTSTAFGGFVLFVLLVNDQKFMYVLLQIICIICGRLNAIFEIGRDFVSLGGFVWQLLW